MCCSINLHTTCYCDTLKVFNYSREFYFRPAEYELAEVNTNWNSVVAALNPAVQNIYSTQPEGIYDCPQNPRLAENDLPIASSPSEIPSDTVNQNNERNLDVLENTNATQSSSDTLELLPIENPK